MSGLYGWMLRSHHPLSTVEGTNMWAKGTDKQLCAKPRAKSKIKNQSSIINNQKSKIGSQNSKSEIERSISKIKFKKFLN
jgi:hypothetical protein